MGNVTVPTAVEHAEAILQRIRAGERLMDIAPDYNISAPAISMALSKHLPDQYDAALKMQGEAKLAKYEDQL